MATIHDIIQQVPDLALRNRILQELERINKQRKFGLVYEEHGVECTPLYGIPIKRGATVARKDGEIKDLYAVLSIGGKEAQCIHKVSKAIYQIPIDELVVVSQFGEPIYPYLQPLDRVENAPDSDLWHTLIQADNYHALQLLDYLYRGQVDCIYIDPPYNTGARDWKYNNDYVDKSDSYRHSKWLSMMEKRLKLAKRLLNPACSVLIVTIDEKEYTRLGLMLEEIFPCANIQMVSSIINPNGAARNKLFTRVEEYVFFVMLGECSPILTERNMLDKFVPKVSSVTWFSLIRTGSNSLRAHSENCFYPIFINNSTDRIEAIGNPLGKGISRESVKPLEGCTTLWPIHGDGEEGVWQLGIEKLKERIELGAIRIRKKKNKFVLTYLRQGQLNEIIDGKLVIVGHEHNGAMVLTRSDSQLVQARTVWNQPSHDATTFGSKLIKQFLCSSDAFKYPKSLYAVHDALYFFTLKRPNALIVDFFAGSGTTLHAVNLLNKEDGGHRRCIMVTNNEISEEEEKTFKAKGLKPGDDEWEDRGIARYVTWPRTRCSIQGVDVNGKPIEGDYQTSLTKNKTSVRNIKQLTFAIPEGREGKDMKKQIVGLLGKQKLAQSLVKDECSFIVSEKYPTSILFDASKSDEWLQALDGQDQVKELYIVTTDNKKFKSIKQQVEELLGEYEETVPVTFPMKDGFASNVEFFKLSFLDKTSIALGRQFSEILPLLWLKAGAKGVRPVVKEDSNMMILTENHFAILCDTIMVDSFIEKVKANKAIEHVFVVTDSESDYMDVANQLPDIKTYQLYRDYLDNFRINIER